MVVTDGKLKRLKKRVGKELSSTLGCFLLGDVWGGLAGAFGSFAVPTSVRSELSDYNLDVVKDDLFGEEWTKYDKRSNWSFHIGRLLTKYSIETVAMYKMVEDIANGGDITWGLLAIPNAVAGICEYRRHRKVKKEN